MVFPLAERNATEISNLNHIHFVCTVHKEFYCNIWNWYGIQLAHYMMLLTIIWSRAQTHTHRTQTRLVCSVISQIKVEKKLAMHSVHTQTMHDADDDDDDYCIRFLVVHYLISIENMKSISKHGYKIQIHIYIIVRQTYTVTAHFKLCWWAWLMAT